MGDTPSIAVQVTSFSSGKLGQQVDTGECYDLANTALTGAGAKTASDYGKITDDADYVWGKAVTLAKAQAGDILQFRNFKFTIVTTVSSKTTHPDGSWDTNSDEQTVTKGRPHHTAVLKGGVAADGSIEVYEQNVPLEGETTNTKLVQLNKLYARGSSPPKKVTTTVAADGSKTVTETTVKITVTGTLWVYRPEKK